MYFSTTEQEDLAIIEMNCPLCNHVSRVKISRQLNFYSIFLIFNFWVPQNKLFGSCGYCHKSFKINEEMEEQLYEMLEKNKAYKKSCLIRNIKSLAITALVILILIIIL